MPRIKAPEYESSQAYVGQDGRVALFDADRCAEIWEKDRDLHKKIGVSRQAMHAYITGRYAPKADRIPLFLEHAKKAVQFVGRLK